MSIGKKRKRKHKESSKKKKKKKNKKCRKSIKKKKLVELSKEMRKAESPVKLCADSAELVSGELVFHKKRGLIARIVKVHYDDPQSPYYTIKTDDGREIQTVASHLTGIVREAKKASAIDDNLENKGSVSQKKPMTREEYEKTQSTVRRVLDEETGRMRLVKGTGEILEEIVSCKRHKQINQQATKGDGASYMSSLLSQVGRS